MIPQPFAKGGGERVYFGPYEYVPNADIVFDFGNTLCTSAFASNIVYNVGSANITGSLIPYNNPGPFYPTLITDNGGLMVTRAYGAGGEAQSNFIQWDWKSTENQTTIYIFELNGAQLSPYTSKLPAPAGASSIASYTSGANPTSAQTANLLVEIYNSSNSANSVFSTTLNVSGSNGTNGFNMVSVEADASTSHKLYINQTLSATDTTSITRTTSGTQTTKFGVSSNLRIMAFLQYPFLLTPKQIRQTYKVFAPRFYT